MESMTIPMLDQNTSNSSTCISSILSSNASEQGDDGILSKLDFSYLPQELQTSGDEEFENIKNKLAENVKTLESKLKFISAPNLKAEENMTLINTKLNTLNNALKEIRDTALIAKEKFTRVKEERMNRFMKCFDCLASHIDYVYKNLLNDMFGQATLVPFNPEEPYLDGINYSCIVPGKRFHFLSSLSGGEQVLAVLTLLFAMHRYEAAPFIVLDEIDAALDKINIKNVVRFIQSNANLIDFIIISLKTELFVNADGLLGVSSRQEGDFLESKIFTLSLKPYRAKEKNMRDQLDK